MKRLTLVAACTAAVLLTGCNDQQSEDAMNKLKAFFNAVKPDTLLLKDLTPGVTTEAQIRDPSRISARSGGYEHLFCRYRCKRQVRRGHAGLDGGKHREGTAGHDAGRSTPAAGQADDHRRISAQERARVELALGRGRRDTRCDVQRAFRPGWDCDDHVAIRSGRRRQALSGTRGYS